MSSLSDEEIGHLKAAFSEKWPDAAEAIKAGLHSHKLKAACLWQGFKAGYELRKQEAEG